MSWTDTLKASALAAIGAAPHAARMSVDLPRLIPFLRQSPASMLSLRATRNGGEVAVIFGEQRWTWAELDDRVGRAAWVFVGNGIRARQPVAVMMFNHPDYLVTVLALSRIGAVAALLNTNLRGAALRHAMQAAGAQLAIVDPEHQMPVNDLNLAQHDSARILAWSDDGLLCGLRLVQGGVPRLDQSTVPAGKGEDPFVFIYTSGTTGLPKAAIVRNQRMVGAGLLFGRLMHQATNDDVIYVPLPLYHSNALMLGFGSALATGAAVVLRRKFSVSAFWSDVVETGATSFVYIGELCRYLLNAPHHPDERAHRLRAAIGNGLRPDIWTAFTDRFAVPVVREFYGSTEGNAFLLNIEGVPGMVGRMLPGQVVVRCDAVTGELARDSNGACTQVSDGESGLLLGKISRLIAFDGYVDEAATEKKIVRNVLRKGDSYFNTGDLMGRHPGRWLSFVDRLGDTFRWKGENVSTTEVAESLSGVAGVREVTVYGVRVPGSDGRAGMAAIVAGPEFEWPTFVAAIMRLPAYQRPLFVRFVDGDLQVTGTFKHQKKAYVETGYDTGRTSDPIWRLVDGAYELIGAATVARD